MGGGETFHFTFTTTEAFSYFYEMSVFLNTELVCMSRHVYECIGSYKTVWLYTTGACIILVGSEA